jgi:hypothetical protein
MKLLHVCKGGQKLKKLTANANGIIEVTGKDAGKTVVFLGDCALMLEEGESLPSDLTLKEKPDAPGELNYSCEEPELA